MQSTGRLEKLFQVNCGQPSPFTLKRFRDVSPESIPNKIFDHVKVPHPLILNIFGISDMITLRKLLIIFDRHKVLTTSHSPKLKLLGLFLLQHYIYDNN